MKHYPFHQDRPTRTQLEIEPMEATIATATQLEESRARRAALAEKMAAYRESRRKHLSMRILLPILTLAVVLLGLSYVY